MLLSQKNNSCTLLRTHVQHKKVKCAKVPGTFKVFHYQSHFHGDVFKACAVLSTMNEF